MAGARYSPRNLKLEALIAVLVSEHTVMREGPLKAKEAAGKRDFDAVHSAPREVGPVFRQHIADEESHVLGLLIERMGVKGAVEEIKVFQQHRPIYQLMKEVMGLAAMPAAELAANQTKLSAMFDEHTAAEEGRVFPRVMSFRGLAMR